MKIITLGMLSLCLRHNVQISLGMLGVITEVTIQCEDSFRLEESLERTSVERCLADLHQMVHSAEHVKLWLEVYSRSCNVFRFQRTEKELRDSDQLWKIYLKV